MYTLTFTYIYSPYTFLRICILLLHTYYEEGMYVRVSMYTMCARGDAFYSPSYPSVHVS